MSKQDQTALLTIIEAVLDDYFADLLLFLPSAASKELARTMACLAKRKQALLSPPVKSRKPKAIPAAQENEWTVITPEAVYKVIPAPDGLRHTDNAITKRGKR